LKVIEAAEPATLLNAPHNQLTPTNPSFNSFEENESRKPQIKEPSFFGIEESVKLNLLNEEG